MSVPFRTILPDINIWLAFVSAVHPHHRLVERMWSTLEGHDFTFCRVTQMGFLRLLTNPSAMGLGTRDSKTAWEIYDYLVREQGVTFSLEPDNLETCWRKTTSAAHFSHHRWTDAYLAAFARASQLTLLTLDTGFKKFENLQMILWS